MPISKRTGENKYKRNRYVLTRFKKNESPPDGIYVKLKLQTIKGIKCVKIKIQFGQSVKVRLESSLSCYVFQKSKPFPNFQS